MGEIERADTAHATVTAAHGETASLPRDHELRKVLNAEVHARPYAQLRSPEQASYVAMLTGEGDVEPAVEHLAELCRDHGFAEPAPEINYFEGEFPDFRLRWERHTEFIGYTFYRRGSFSSPFAEPPIHAVPKAWLERAPGKLLVGIHVALERVEDGVSRTGDLTRYFAPEYIAGSRMSGGVATAWTDFRIHDDGFGRILVQDLGLRERQAGRLVQRLLEIETYRMMALLSFPVARSIGPLARQAEEGLAGIMSEMMKIEDIADEKALLGRLTSLAVEVEACVTDTGFRFAAGKAYFALVTRRIEELREERIEGLQTIEEFMERRLTPAMSTCRAARTRLEDLSRRIARATNLLRTRVNVGLEIQNRNLLQSMNRRARLQLRLQSTLEGLSVAAISYYLTGLIYYLAKAGQKMGLNISPDLIAGLSIPFVVALTWVAIWRLRRAVTRDTVEG